MFLRLVYHFTLTNRYIYLNYYDHRTNDPNAIAFANFLKFLASNICKYIIFNIEVQYVCITAYFYNKNSSPGFLNEGAIFLCVSHQHNRLNEEEHFNSLDNAFYVRIVFFNILESMNQMYQLINLL